MSLPFRILHKYGDTSPGDDERASLLRCGGHRWCAGVTGLTLISIKIMLLHKNTTFFILFLYFSRSSVHCADPYWKKSYKNILFIQKQIVFYIFFILFYIFLYFLYFFNGFGNFLQKSIQNLRKYNKSIKKV